MILDDATGPGPTAHAAWTESEALPEALRERGGVAPAKPSGGIGGGHATAFKEGVGLSEAEILK
jgi:hypothetical protein